MVGPPGIGKSVIDHQGRELLLLVPGLRLAPSSISRQKLIDDLSQSCIVSPGPNGPVFQTSYSAFLGELATFIRIKDFEFMAELTDLYDCKPVWESSTYRHGNLKVEGAYLTMLGGITPKGIAQSWGREAFGLGFTSRLILVHSADSKPADLLSNAPPISYQCFAPDLAAIAALQGEFKIASRSLLDQIHQWNAVGMPPTPTDPRLSEYCARRLLHFIKLCMIYSASEDDSLEIRPNHVVAAKATLLESEASMPAALEFIAGSPAHWAIVDIHKWLVAEYAATGSAISEQRLKRRLILDIGPQHIDSTIKELHQAGMVIRKIESSGNYYVPASLSDRKE